MYFATPTAQVTNMWELHQRRTKEWYTCSFFCCTLREVFRWIHICQMKRRTPYGFISDFLTIGYLAQFAAFIMANVYRLEHEGKVCSGDYLSDSSSGYLQARGSFIWGWLIVGYILSGIGCCLGCALLILLLVNWNRPLVGARC